MTLITCKKCGIQFGRSVRTCIRCGASVEYSEDENLQLREAAEVDQQSQFHISKTLIAFVPVAMIGSLYFGGLLVIGSITVLVFWGFVKLWEKLIQDK